jgi:hypothetical protein
LPDPRAGSKVAPPATEETVTHRRAALALVVGVAVVTPARAGLSPELVRALGESKYVYVQSERKSGELGRPAEIWFLYEGGAVYVGTRPTSWRVRRIKAGWTRARVAVGTVDGPAFTAKGEIVKDPAIETRMLAEYAKKYPDGWARYADSFREGFKSGERVVVRYTPAP